MRRLSVNGILVDEERGTWLVSDRPPRRVEAVPVSYLCARVSLANVDHVVEAPMGTSGGTLACRIVVDGEVVGGDRDVEFDTPEPARWEEARRVGRASFTAKRGIRPAIFIGGPLLLVSWLAGQPMRVLVTVSLLTAVLGFSRGDLLWKNAERRYQRRLQKLGDPTWAGELTFPRQVASLILFSVGGFLLLVAVVALLAFATALRNNAAPATIWISIPLAIIGLGLFLLFKGAALRASRKAPDGLHAVAPPRDETEG